jgi:hypothetical protein
MSTHHLIAQKAANSNDSPATRRVEKRGETDFVFGPEDEAFVPRATDFEAELSEARDSHELSRPDGGDDESAEQERGDKFVQEPMESAAFELKRFVALEKSAAAKELAVERG